MSAHLLRTRVAFLVLVLLPQALLSVPSRLAGQDRLQGDRVTLAVSVRDNHGRVVTGLGPTDFTVLEDGKEQKIELFNSGSPEQMAVVFLIDVSGSRDREMPGAELQPVAKFFKLLLREGDQALVARFGDQVETTSDFSSDPDILDQRMRTPPKASLGRSTALLDAILWACNDKLAKIPKHRIVIVLTDGQENASAHSLEYVRDQALRDGVAIYFLALEDASNSRRATMRAEFLMENLATTTGGEVLFLHSQKDVWPAFRYIGDGLSSQYLLTYAPQDPKRDGRFHKLKVEVKRGGAHAHAAQGYYARKQ